MSGDHLEDILTVRVPELLAYQDSRYAQHYADRVESVRRAEDTVWPGSTVLSEAVATYLYKLMAYKDEYEVARLAIDPEFTAQITEDFGEGAKMAVRLHPPALRAMGMKNKIALGEWARPALVGLAKAKRLRGTKFDVFGRIEARKLERELLAEYEAFVDRLVHHMRTASPDAMWLARAAAAAELPDMVRGYEEIKERNAAEYRTEMAERTAELFTG